MDLNQNSILNFPELNLGQHISYICGSCGEELEKKPIEEIICDKCSGKILFKKRKNSGVTLHSR